MYPDKKHTNKNMQMKGTRMKSIQTECIQMIGIKWKAYGLKKLYKQKVYIWEKVC